MPQKGNESGTAWVPIPGSKPDWPMDVKTQSYAGRQRMKRTYPGHEDDASNIEDVMPYVKGQSKMMARQQLLATGAYEKSSRAEKIKKARDAQRKK